MTTLSPQEYFNKIKDLRDPEAIEALCLQLADQLYPDPNNKNKNKATPYNKLIKTIPNEELVEGVNAFIYTKTDGTLWKRHLHFKYVGLTRKEWGIINDKTVVLDKLENRRQIDVTKYLEATCKLLLSDEYNELSVGLVAASGRRPYEIWVQGKFAITKELPEFLKHGYFVTFSGQLKKRDYDLPEDEKARYRIGVLVPAEIFTHAFNKLRKSPRALELRKRQLAMVKAGASETEIEKTLSDSVTPQMKRIIRNEFADCLPVREGDKEVNNRSLRAAYTRLITDRDCPKSMVDLLWASRAVGHFIDNEKPDDRQLRDLVTTLGYYDYYADTEVPFVSAPQKSEREKATSVRVLASDYEVIKELQKKWNLPNQQAVVQQLIQSIEEVEKLKQQLLEAQSQVTQLQNEKEELMNLPQPKETETQATQPAAEDLQVMIKRMVAEALTEALSQSTSNPEQSTPATTPIQRQPKAKPEQPEKDWESVPSEELRASKHRGAAEEKIRRSFLAITSYNDAQPSNETRWAINNQGLRQLSGCNGMLVATWMENHKIAIDDHNTKYGLGQYHNKGKGDISQAIKW
jgi:Telomere resolvase